MRNLASLLFASAVMILPFAAGARAHEKPLPPAFGKELAPDEGSKGKREAVEEEIEEKQDARAKRQHAHGGHHATAVRGLGGMHLDTDDDDGGDDL